MEIELKIIHSIVGAGTSPALYVDELPEQHHNNLRSSQSLGAQALRPSLHLPGPMLQHHYCQQKYIAPQLNRS